MTKQATNAGRVRVDPSVALVRCAGCGAALPAGEAIVVDFMAADVRCDLCWRSLLAAQAAHWRHEQTDALGPQGEKRDDH